MRGIYIERAIMLGLMVVALFLASKLRAETAIFKDGVLQVPQVLMVDTLDVVGSGSMPMVRMQYISSEARVIRGDIAVLQAKVQKSWECVELNPARRS